MKDQYVGDISDFEKYALLRALSLASGLPLAVCWMLTPPDASGEGSRVQYLEEPERFRHLDPPVFDRLKRIIVTGNRNVAAVEGAGVLERATFFSRPLEDHLSSRLTYFREVWETLTEPALVFFDPDIGLAGANTRRGRVRSSMYVFDEELAEAYGHEHSLVIFDHWKRVQRIPYLLAAFKRVRTATRASSAFAVWGRPRVAFIVVPQEKHADALERAARKFAERWPGIDLANETPAAQRA
jgi:hypothetical protein